jgi:pimeloyl-ACP methyl ester carboxylesterase
MRGPSAGEVGRPDSVPGTMPETSEIEPTDRTLTANGVTLHYLDWGNEDAPLLLLVHGSRDNARSWDWTARALRDRYHVVAPDLRGHGDSGWSPDGAYLLLYHVLDLVELVLSLESDHLRIVGHSLGGNISLRTVALYPDLFDKLVVVDGLGPGPARYAEWNAAGPVARTREWIARRRTAESRPPRSIPTFDEVVARMRQTNPRLSDVQARHLAEHGAHHHEGGWNWKHDPRTGLFSPEDLLENATRFGEEIHIPTLLYWGSESFTTNPELDGRGAHFPNHRTILYDGAGHWLHHDRFDDFVASVAEFLDEE